MKKKKKILIIDDDMELVKMLRLRLEASGYEVISAFDGYLGVSKAHEERPDLIILDIMMPTGDGFSVHERLKLSTHTCNIPIVYLTGKGGSEDEERAIKLGAKHFLKKPYDPKVLLETVDNILGQQEGLS